MHSNAVLAIAASPVTVFAPIGKERHVSVTRDGGLRTSAWGARANRLLD